MIYLVVLVVLVMATARLTRLIYFDDLTMPVRQWIDRTFGPNSFLSKVVWCPWCASVWAAMPLSGAVLAVGWKWWAWPLGAVLTAWIPLVLAVSYPAGWIVDRETTLTSRGE